MLFDWGPKVMSQGVSKNPGPVEVGGMIKYLQLQENRQSTNEWEDAESSEQKEMATNSGDTYQIN